MVCNNSSQQIAGTHAQWEGSYTSMIANIKPEPQSYGQYGCQYGAACQSAEQILDNIADLKDIKLEDLCYLDNEDISEFALDDARSLEQLRSSSSPQSQYSTANSTSSSVSDIDCCGGSPASSSVESWLSDQMVPTTSPKLQSQHSEDNALYIDTTSHKRQQTMPQLYRQQYTAQHYQQTQAR